jgi:hypothetical protein
LITLFTISGCANKPNLIPYGYSEIFKVSDRSKIAAEVDYSIIVAVDPALDAIDASQIKILWTKTGEIIWNKPFWNKITWWRFALISGRNIIIPDLTVHPEGAPPLCSTDWTQALGEDLTEVPCEFKVMNYLATPLIGILDYRLGGDKDIPPGQNEASDGVARLYYIVNK